MSSLLYRVAVLILGTLAARAANEELVVVVHASGNARAISVEDLRDIFLGERHKLPDGPAVSPVFLRNGPTHEAFLKAYVGKSDGAFRAGWMRLVFTGKGTLPRTFESEADLLDYVSVTPGAIGYARSAGSRPNVKVLSVK
jgi:ABC-type phosphate transport system substrate-binding protein